MENTFSEVYTKFKLNFYRRIFGRFQDREASLTAVETFCVEAIYALHSPTVNELAQFLEISQPNMAYKVASLVKKGYIRKRQSPQDKREYHLEVTDKFMEYYGMSCDYIHTVILRAEQRFAPQELETLERMLRIISRELMPEIPSGRQDEDPS